MTTYNYSGLGSVLISASVDANKSYVYTINSVYDSNIQDYGSVISAYGAFDDYGSVDQSSGPTLDNGLVPNNVENSTSPFGTLNVSGSSAYSESVNSISSPILLNLIGEVVSPNISFTFSNILFGSVSISGQTIEKNTESYVASGSLFGFGEKIEKRTYGYGQGAVSDNTQDFGFITNNYEFIDDYGFTTGSPGPVVEYGEITLEVVELVSSFGSLNLSGQAVEKFTSDYPTSTQLFNISGQVIEKDVDSYVTSGSTNISGQLIEKNTESYVANGSLFSFGEKVESRTYVYDEETVEEGVNDYGLITNNQQFIDDYGFTSGLPGPTIEYGLTTENIDQINYPFGSLNLSGQAVEKFTSDYPTSTQLFTIYSKALVKSNPRFFGRGSFEVSGQLIEKNTESYVASGSLFSFGEKLESRTYVYDEETISDPIGDNGLITDPVTSYEDYGIVLDEPGPTVEFGELDQNPSDSQYPFGSLSFSGQAVEKFTSDYPESTQLFVIYGKAIIKVNPRFFGRGSFEVSGQLIEKNTESYVGSGSLFSFGEKLESRTYVYDESSIENSVDGGLITDPITSYEDYGLVVDESGPTVEFGLISEDPSDSQYPFGSLSFSGQAVEKFTSDYPESTQLFVISGQVIEKLEQSILGGGFLDLFGEAIEKNTESYVANGSLFSFGEKVESRTYVYDESSIENSVDGGLITDSITSYEDYGLVTENSTSTLEFGSISENPLDYQYPFGSLSFSGLSVSEKFTSDYPESTQLFVIDGSASDIKLSFVSDSTQLFEISGQGLAKDVDSYVANGSLFSFGEKVESRTYVYDESSIEDPIDDGGFITDPITSYQDYELITGSIVSVIDHGSVPENPYTNQYPFGSLSISGAASDEKFTSDYPESTQLFVIDGSASDIKLSFASDSTQLVQISGQGIEKDVDSYVANGSLFTLDSGNESFTYSNYDGSGLINLSGQGIERFTSDYPESVQLFTISGSVSDIKLSFASDNTQLFEISGQGIEKDTESYVANGSLFALDSVNESFTYANYDGSGSLSISGSKLESFAKGLYTGTTILHVISGNSRNYSPIYPRNSGDPNAGQGTIQIVDANSIYRAIIPYRGRGTIFVRGTGNESFSITNYNGSGKINLSGIASTREIAVYTDTGSGLINLFKGTQPIIEKNTDSYVGSGNVDLSGESITLRRFAVKGTGSINLTGSANEALSSQTPEETVLFDIVGNSQESFVAQPVETEVLYTFNGTIVESVTYSENGSGQLNLTPLSASSTYVPNIVGRGLIRFQQHLVDNTYDTCDSVDITSDYLSSASVSFVANPPENTQLFNIIGDADTRRTRAQSYVGVGNIVISGFATDIKETDSYVGIGTLFVSSTISEFYSESDSYSGSGSIFTISGSSSSTVVSEINDTTLLNVSGSASVQFSRLYDYSNVIIANLYGEANSRVEKDFTYSGSSIITLYGELVHPDIRFVPTPKGSGLININGSGEESIVYDEQLVGNRSLFAISSGFESYTRSTYVGIGTLSIVEIDSSTINNPYQIPRTYVVII